MLHSEPPLGTPFFDLRDDRLNACPAAKPIGSECRVADRRRESDPAGYVSDESCEPDELTDYLIFNAGVAVSLKNEEVL